MTSPPFKRSGYRADIDGLRAVAVAGIVLFHAQVPYFSGGFVGVDVFFVISGYLITSILLSDMAADRFSFVTFFNRRARRILPALAVVCAVATVAAWELAPPAQLREFGKSLLSVATFSSNIFFYGREGYFAQASELTPMLHMWSLAVEEQFYIVFPPLLLAAWHFGRRFQRADRGVTPLLVCLAALSLAACLVGARWFPQFNFYFFLTRAWEFLAGSLVFCLGIRLPRRLAQGASLLGLLLIVLPFAGLGGGASSYPSLATLVPVIGAALVIGFGDAGGPAGALLSWRPIALVGAASYSIYLWHQPLFVFARLKGLDLEEPAILALLGLVLAGLSYASWRWVEVPFRRNRLSRPGANLTVYCLVTLLPVFVAGQAIVNLKGFAANRYSAAELAMMKPPRNEDEQRLEECHLEITADPGTYERSRCLETGAGRTVLFIGDSHASSLAPALRRQVEAEGWTFGQMTAAACMPLITTFTHPGRHNRTPRCEAINAAVRERIERGDIEVLVVEAAMGIYLSQDPVFTYPGYGWEFLEALTHLRQHVKRLVVLGPFVLWTPTLPDILFREMREGKPVDGLAPRSPNGVRQAVLDADRFLAERLPGLDVDYVPVSGALCRERDCLRLVPGDAGPEPITHDYGHLGRAGGEYVAREVVMPKLGRILSDVQE